MIGGMMYRPDLKDALDEGYTEALDECKEIVKRTLDIFLETSKTIDEERTIQRVVHSIQKQMEEL
jgi:hypothetical protein